MVQFVALEQVFLVFEVLLHFFQLVLVVINDSCPMQVFFIEMHHGLLVLLDDFIMQVFFDVLYFLISQFIAANIRKACIIKSHITLSKSADWRLISWLSNLAEVFREDRTWWYSLCLHLNVWHILKRWNQIVISRAGLHIWMRQFSLCSLDKVIIPSWHEWLWFRFL